jgi:hypothetical protein
LDSVNYSRERWEDYLSFRTDSYAFVFDENNQLKRTNDFYTNVGFQTFDDHLVLINDFVEKSNFRAFFQDNKKYYRAVSAKYNKTQYIKEMREFLVSEFGKQQFNDKIYNIVLSTFVGRMNCHRKIDSITTADFITIPHYVLSDTISADEKDIATSIHNLFTEMDHGYVNPTTNHYKDLVAKKFDASLWDRKSGYNDSDASGTAVFNEYMTWAVYDIFLHKHFPNFADTIGLYFSYQNDSRGFKFSQLFTQKLLELYKEKGNEETIKDLYPKLLEWTYEIQKDLLKPEIISNKRYKKANKTKVTISFSQEMKKVDTITTLFQDGRSIKNIVDLNVSDHNLNWNENGTAVSFDIRLPEEWEAHYFQFNWWNLNYPLISEKGVLVKYGSFFKLNDK